MLERILQLATEPRAVALLSAGIDMFILHDVVKVALSMLDAALGRGRAGRPPTRDQRQPHNEAP